MKYTKKYVSLTIFLLFLFALPLPGIAASNRTLVVLVNYSDSGSPPFSVSEMNQFIFFGRVAQYFQEVSYGQAALFGDVKGWYTIPANKINADGTCNYPNLSNYMGGILKNDGIDLNQYARVIFIDDSDCRDHGLTIPPVKKEFSGDPDPEFSFYYTLYQVVVGADVLRDFVSAPQYVFPINAESLLAHEISHSLGILEHASMWDCGTQISGNNCIHDEYGNHFDVLGSAFLTFSSTTFAGITGGATHLSAYFKEKLGWLQQSSIVNATSSGIYTLFPLESSAGVRSIKISIPGTNDSYYLEYRRPLGFDSILNDPKVVSNQNGLFVNWFVDRGADVPYFRLLDMRPNSGPSLRSLSNPDRSADFDEVTLNGSSIFQDVAADISIGPIVSADANSISFKINLAASSSSSTLPGDINGDKIVNSLDWSLMSLKWLTADTNADLNKDGAVNSLDWSIMSGNWLKTI